MKTSATESISINGINLLETLGIKDEWIETICKRALSDYNQSTPHDAITAPGSYAYLAAVRATRDVLCPHGWQINRINNLELTVNPKNNISIVVSSGNKDTGKKKGFPKTKNQKGKQTAKFITDNFEQMLFWPELEPQFGKNPQTGSTWILLYHFDLKNEMMRRELSLPIELELDEWKDEVKITGWQSRIIFPPIEFSPSISSLYDDEYYDDTESSFDIIIRRKDDE